ncbi:MAG TPA: PDZ domain-containing protein [Candidatus Acidoferrales bacterium]|nr:PDZ domain-containing protein [Candidatus Acidoferrales bacterium]
MNTHTHPEITGVGFGLAIIGGTVTVVYVVPDTPAYRAGLTPGMIVQKIDDVITEGMQEKDWHQKLRGLVDTKVRLEVTDTTSKRSRVVELNREKFILPAALPKEAVLDYGN